MSAPQSVQEMVFMSDHFRGEWFTQYRKFNAWIHRSKCFVIHFWIGE